MLNHEHFHVKMCSSIWNNEHFHVNICSSTNNSANICWLVWYMSMCCMIDVTSKHCTLLTGVQIWTPTDVMCKCLVSVNSVNIWRIWLVNTVNIWLVCLWYMWTVWTSDWSWDLNWQNKGTYWFTLMIAYIALFSALLSRLTAFACGSTWVTGFL